MKKSAGGKVILFGEHSVVYGRPAIAAPVSGLRIYAEIVEGEGKIYNPALDQVLDLSEREAGLVTAVFLALEKMGETNADFDIHISGDLPPSGGLGSGAAVCVAIMRALAKWFGKEFTEEELTEMSFKTETIYHGNPSGIDNTVVSYELPVYFVRGKPIEVLKIGKPFTIVIGDTGVKGSTKELVAGVGERVAAEPEKYNAIMDEIGSIVEKARKIIESGDSKELGPLMNQNQELLEQLGVSHPSLENLISAAREAGALGAKLAGAGGGGNMIALCDGNEKAVAEALQKAGAKRVFTTIVGE